MELRKAVKSEILPSVLSPGSTTNQTLKFSTHLFPHVKLLSTFVSLPYKKNAIFYVSNHDYFDLGIVQFASAINTHNYSAAAPFHCCTHQRFLVDCSPVRWIRAITVYIGNYRNAWPDQKHFSHL